MYRGAFWVFMMCALLTPAAFGAYQVGQTVADFTLPNAYGQSVSYSHFSGLVVLINFWTSS